MCPKQAESLWKQKPKGFVGAHQTSKATGQYTFRVRNQRAGWGTKDKKEQQNRKHTKRKKKSKTAQQTCAVP